MKRAEKYQRPKEVCDLQFYYQYYQFMVYMRTYRCYITTATDTAS